jgi:hypothetical protein
MEFQPREARVLLALALIPNEYDADEIRRMFDTY